MRLLRSMLFVPGNNMRMITKAAALPSDAVILDLEDAVPMQDKETARIFVKDSLETVKAGGTTVVVRVNSFATGLLEGDLDSAVSPSLDCVMVPKVDSKADITTAEKMIAEREAGSGAKHGSIEIMPLLETAKGVLNAFEIAGSSTRVIALGFGAVDFTRDLGTSWSPDAIELLYPRAHISMAAHARGVQPIDTPWVNLQDREGLVKDSKLARQLGFAGKMVIHPDQINPVNTVFSVSKEEVEYARKVAATFMEAKKAGAGAISLEGKMIDEANFRQMQDLLLKAEAIEKKMKKEG